MLSFGVARGYLGYGGDRFGLILFGRWFEVGVFNQGARGRSGGVCEYLKLLPGAMVDFGCALVEVRDGLPLSSAVSSIARLLDGIQSLDACN
jgi:hypothetical protein